MIALRQSIPPRNFYSEESYQLKRRSPDRASNPSAYNTNHPYTNMNMNHLSSLQRFQQNRQSTMTTPGYRLGSTIPLEDDTNLSRYDGTDHTTTYSNGITIRIT